MNKRESIDKDRNIITKNRCLLYEEKMKNGWSNYALKLCSCIGIAFSQDTNPLKKYFMHNMHNALVDNYCYSQGHCYILLMSCIKLCTRVCYFTTAPVLAEVVRRA